MVLKVNLVIDFDYSLVLVKPNKMNIKKVYYKKYIFNIGNILITFITNKFFFSCYLVYCSLFPLSILSCMTM